jgi:transposase InsO family protein
MQHEWYMSGKGECLDNAVAESFFGTLKAELLLTQTGGRFASKMEAVTMVGDYIENFYNRVRITGCACIPHWTIAAQWRLS